MDKYLFSLVLIGFVALSTAVPSTVLKFQSSFEQKDDSVDEIMKILAKDEPLDRDRPLHFFQKWGIDPNNRLKGFKWSDCGGKSSKIIFHDLTVTPDPIVLPGTIKVSLNVEVKEDIADGLGANVELTKIIGPVDIPIPCIDDVGSCDYKDVCSLLTRIQKCPPILTKHNITCRCPLKKGSYIFPTTTFQIPSDPVPGGGYTLKVQISYNDEPIGCLSLAASFNT